MRFLHTADWHVGRKLGRIDRRREFEQVLDELVAIAGEQKVDAVVVSGDLLDRALAPVDSISLVIDALIRLASGGRKVIAIAGNHDSAALFEMLGRLLDPMGIHLASRIRRPQEGGIVEVPSLDGKERGQVAVFPFLHEAEIVDFMAESEEWFKGYSQRVLGIAKALCSSLDRDAVGILAGHFFVEGAELGGGERRIHIGPHYAATAQAIPPGAHYVALGHIHRPQEVPGAAVPARYAGSLLALDFSERTHAKEVVVVDAVVGRPAKLTRISLSSGRKLLRVEDTLESLEARAVEFGEAYLDVRVQTSGPVFGLGERVRSFLPNAVIVQPVYERATSEVPTEARADRPIAEIYGEYHASTHGHGVPAPLELIEALRSLEEEVARAAT